MNKKDKPVENKESQSNGHDAQLRLLAHISLRINRMETSAEIADFVCQQVKAIIGEGYVLVTLMNEATQTISIKAMQGFEDNKLISAALRLTGTDPRKMQYPVIDMTPEELAIFRSGHLQIVEGGLYIMLVRKYPRAVCTAVEHLLNIHFINTMGFIHHDRHLGGIIILTDADSAVETNRVIIENIVAQAAVILSRIYTENLLRESEERFKQIAESADEWIWEIDECGLYTYCSPVVEKILGYKPDEMVGKKHFYDLFTLDVKEELKKAAFAAFKNKQVIKNLINHNIHKNGQTVFLETNGCPILDNKGNLLGYRGADNDITVRKKTEEAIKSAAEEWRNTFDSITDMISILDKEHKIVRVNKHFANALKTVPQELVGKYCYRTIHGIEQSSPLCPHIKAMETLKTELVEYYEPKLGIHLEETASPLFNSNGVTIGTIHIMKDITERKRAEETLKAKSDTLFKFSTLVPGMLFQFMRRTDGTFCVPFTNEAIRVIFGCSPDDVKDDFSPISRVILPDDLPKVIESIEASARGLTRWECEYRVQIPGQPIRTLWGQSIPEKQHDDCIIWHGFNADITERKQAEEAIRKSEMEFHSLAESMPQIVWITRADGWNIYFNQQWVDYTGLTLEESYGHGWNKPFHPEDQKRAWDAWQRAVQYNDEYSLECRLRRYDGVYHWWLVRGVPLLSTDGKIQKWFGTCTDIEQIKQAEAENLQLRDKAEMSSRLAAIGEMAAGIAHEINNPLTGVIGFSQLLEERPDLPPDAKDQLRVIADGGNRVKDIVRRMLTFARQTKPMRTSGSINELIEASLGLRSYVLRTANIEVVKHLDPDLPWVVVDPGQMQQVFLNLIVNAEYAMKKAHGKGKLTIITKKIDDHIHISFKDDGTGMSQETKDKLFHPFFTTKDVGEGTGLGLGLSRSIILEHDGTIEVESQPDQGATFIITLPITQLAEEAPAEVVTATPVEKVKVARILVVDDEETIRSLVSTILARNGHIVDATGDAVEALSKLNNNSYDAVLMDIRMPGMSGMELYVKVLEKHPELSNRFIFITGDTSDTTTRVFLEQNKLSYITKPFDRETLLKKVNELL